MKKLVVFAVSLVIGANIFANPLNHFSPGKMVNDGSSTLPVHFTDRKSFSVSILYWDAILNQDSPGDFAPDAKDVHTRALSDFQVRFNGVSDVRWFSDTKGYTSYFMKNGFNDRAFYSKNGRWVYSLLYGNEQNLPKDIRSAVKSIYYDWNIKVVVEVQTSEGQGYVVYLEDATQFKVIKVNSEKEIETILDLNKQ